MEFNPDGSLNVKPKPDYVRMLRAIREMPFPVGQKLLLDFLSGEETRSIQRHKLQFLPDFGSLAYQEEELVGMLSRLEREGCIERVRIRSFPVLRLTEAGEQEIDMPSLDIQYDTTVTEEDRVRFAEYGSVLDPFNDEQKKAIIADAPQVLCVAGAGSGKTTVLTNRIRILVKTGRADPKKILAITFTRKARKEMMRRLARCDYLRYVRVETFHSFCEKILKRYADRIYDRPMRVITYGDKMRIMQHAMQEIGISMEAAVNRYFVASQKRGKTPEQLMHIFMNDCFFVRDHRRAHGLEELPKSGDLVIKVCDVIDRYMLTNGLRDFSDQLLDAAEFLEENPDCIPGFDHVLVDEYQDVNAIQVHLLDLLAPNSLFCVGDPRQSIYGWRGSDVRFIMDFAKKFPESETVYLKRNYRSSKRIVRLVNEAIRRMGMPDLEAEHDTQALMTLKRCGTQDQEHHHISALIQGVQIPLHEIFVLARTNRQLNELSGHLHAQGVPHVVRSDDIHGTYEDASGKVMLATVHAIKGMEAEMVIVMGCNNFPCHATEHPVIDMLKVDYDKTEEERRLLYVAMSRAKRMLHLTYTGKLSYFLTSDMRQMLGHQTPLREQLREWRSQKACGRPEYLVLSNDAIEHIARRKPSDMDELLETHGIGPAKVEMYGEEILDMVRRSQR